MSSLDLYRCVELPFLCQSMTSSQCTSGQAPAWHCEEPHEKALKTSWPMYNGAPTTNGQKHPHLSCDIYKHVMAGVSDQCLLLCHTLEEMACSICFYFFVSGNAL